MPGCYWQPPPLISIPWAIPIQLVIAQQWVSWLNFIGAMHDKWELSSNLNHMGSCSNKFHAALGQGMDPTGKLHLELIVDALCSVGFGSVWAHLEMISIVPQRLDSSLYFEDFGHPYLFIWTPPASTGLILPSFSLNKTLESFKRIANGNEEVETVFHEIQVIAAGIKGLNVMRKYFPESGQWVSMETKMSFLFVRLAFNPLLQSWSVTSLRIPRTSNDTWSLILASRQTWPTPSSTLAFHLSR